MRALRRKSSWSAIATKPRHTISATTTRARAFPRNTCRASSNASTASAKAARAKQAARASASASYAMPYKCTAAPSRRATAKAAAWSSSSRCANSRSNAGRRLNGENKNNECHECGRQCLLHIRGIRLCV